MTEARMHTGSCLCGEVAFRLSAELRPVINCHCRQCQKTHGNFAAYTSVPLANLHYVKQATLQWYRSSNFAQRGFCNRCGASLFWQRDGYATISIAAGALDAPTGLQPEKHIFVASQGDYYTITDDLPRCAGSGEII